MSAMSAKSAVVRARVTPETKIDAEKVLQHLGISVSEAINLFLVQVKLKRSLPFDIEIPNRATARAIRAARAGKGVIESNDADDMFKKLGI